MSRKKRITLVLFIGFIGLMVSTQVFAWKLGYQEALGGNLNGVYAPWSIICWSLRWYALYPSLIMGVWSAGVCVSSILLLLFLRYEGLIKSALYKG